MALSHKFRMLFPCHTSSVEPAQNRVGGGWNQTRLEHSPANTYLTREKHMNKALSILIADTSFSHLTLFLNREM